MTMMRFLAILFFLGLVVPARADVVLSTGTIRSQQIIGPNDVILDTAVVPGALTALEEAIGREARINIYPGRPVRAGDLQEPAEVDRNEVVTLQLDQFSEKGGTLSVFNAQGQRVYYQENAFQVKQEVQLPIAQLPVGSYWASIQLADQTIQQAFIIQR